MTARDFVKVYGCCAYGFGISWALFTLCFLIINIIIFAWPQWIGDTLSSPGVGYVGKTNSNNQWCAPCLKNVPFLRAKAECFARLCHRLGVCLSVRPSVRLSVTLVICIKTVQASITKSSLWAAPRSLVYRDKISCHWVQGFPSNVEEGYPLKKTSFCRYWLE